jgi:hypothetical protein
MSLSDGDASISIPWDTISRVEENAHGVDLFVSTTGERVPLRTSMASSAAAQDSQKDLLLSVIEAGMRRHAEELSAV